MNITERDALANFGNANILFTYIDYFQKQIDINKEFTKSIHEAPNYFAWLHIISEQVFYRIKELLFYKTKDSNSFEKTYRQLIDNLSDYNIDKTIIENVIKFAKIRHILVHKGFPNVHEIPAQGVRMIAEGIDFNGDEVYRICDFIRKPNNYSILQNEWKNINAALNRIDNDINIDTGLFHSKKAAK